MSLRILSFNIHGGCDMWGWRDLVRINEFIDRHHIDIAVFQEMETRASRGGALMDIHTLAGPSRPYHVPGLTMVEDDEKGGGWYGNLIVSRYPILRSHVHDLETSKKHEPRNAVDATIDTPLGPIRIIGTHLSLSPIERMTEVKNLVGLIDAVEEEEKNPMLLMGDINEWRNRSRLLDYLNDILTPAPCGRTFPAILPLLNLDRVWSHNMGSRTVTATRLNSKDAKKLSDHLPVLIKVS